MDTFDLLLMAGSLCGIIMVLGGILLLYKGAISLNNVSGEEAFTVEFKKELRISTQYPALGIFIIGLSFVAFSVWMGKPEMRKLTVKARAIDVSEPMNITLKANSWKSSLQHTGDVLETFYPDVDTIQIVVSAPGYEPHIKTVQISSLQMGTADLGNIRLDQKVFRTEITGGTIERLPDGANVPPITGKHQFGGAH